MSATTSATTTFLPTTTDEDYSNWSETEAWIIYYYVLTFVIVFTIWMHINGTMYNQQRLISEGQVSYYDTQATVKKTAFYMSLALYGSYTMNVIQIVMALVRFNPFSGYCKAAYTLLYMGVVFQRFCNYNFYLMRARLSGVFKLKWAERYLLAFLGVGLILCAVFPLPGTKKKNDSTGRPMCFWEKADMSAPHYVLLALFGVVDLSATVFFLYIFGKPVLEIRRKAANQNVNQSAESEAKKDTAIKLNFLFSLLAVLSTLLFAATFFIVPLMAWLFITDYLINTLCLFCMLRSNRRVLSYTICCCKRSKEYNKQRQNVVSRVEVLAQKQDSQLFPEALMQKPSVALSAASNTQRVSATFDSVGLRRRISLSPYGMKSQGAWSYKSKTFFQWMAWMYCPCGYRCFICVWEDKKFCERHELPCEDCWAKRRRRKKKDMKKFFMEHDIANVARGAEKEANAALAREDPVTLKARAETAEKTFDLVTIDDAKEEPVAEFEMQPSQEATSEAM